MQHDMDINRANARLIAAAPKLLEALAALLDIDPDPDPDGFFAPEYDEACDRGRAAIAEATE